MADASEVVNKQKATHSKIRFSEKIRMSNAFGDILGDEAASSTPESEKSTTTADDSGFGCSSSPIASFAESELPATSILADELAEKLHDAVVTDRTTTCSSADAEAATLLKSALTTTTVSLEKRRRRTTSGSNVDDVIRRKNKVVYTAGRPPWYDCHGSQSREPFIIGICGGSASGKTTVAKSIIELLDVPWVTLLNMDSFYKVLDEEQHRIALASEYDFDHPSAFDFDMMIKTVQRLKQGKRVEVPIYNFSTHSREKNTRTMYGASVLILEGILTFHNKEILEMMDLKIFVDADSDTRLARRLSRDICERGRDVLGVLKQVEKFVKPSFDNFIAPSMQNADIIIPRGGDNHVAIDLIVRHIQSKLSPDLGSQSSYSRALLASNVLCNNGKSSQYSSPPTLHLLKQTPQLRCMHTMMRDRNTPRDEFIFYSNRVMRLLLEHALSLMPHEPQQILTPLNQAYEGRRRKPTKICGVSILRAGEAMETALREVVKDCTISKILIQTNPDTLEPELYYLRLPSDIQQCHVLLMDTTVATGAAAMMGIRILLEHDVDQENVTLVSLLMSEVGVNSIAYAFPKVKLVTSAVDKQLSENYYILPGIGNFGDRYFGTDNDECDLSEMNGYSNTDD